MIFSPQEVEFSLVDGSDKCKPHQTPWFPPHDRKSSGRTVPLQESLLSRLVHHLTVYTQPKCDVKVLECDIRERFVIEYWE